MNNNYFDNDDCQNNFRRPLPIRPIFCVMQTPTGPTGPTPGIGPTGPTA